ncbi:MAG TPA: class II fructose-bisphosphate aldolase [Candidatus Eisenbacteria bacterium]|nr:class II fructose-bisphosphate aldolase [Candidatus Eisenbacteria bacterium]
MPMELQSLDEVRQAVAVLATGNGEALDRLVWTGVFGAGALRDAARQGVFDQCRSEGLYPASIHDLYLARGRGQTPLTFTVPAINIRGMAYDTARALFRARAKLDAGAVICEIARSEISYTDQRPAEYAFVVLAAALREGWRGPVFLQGDHFQINAKKFAADPAGEKQAVLDLAAEAMRAGFHNLDVDTSTLVCLDRPTHREQQFQNGSVCAEITAFIRAHQPAGVCVSVGGEIGEVGGKNSTAEELVAFVEVFQAELARRAPGAPGMSKISIQTGTSHGGVPLPDGTIARVKLDLDTLESLSRLARERYGFAGAVQHGASTLPADLFGEFPRRGACEIHLATEFQNMIFDSPAFPAELKAAIYAGLRAREAGDRKPTDTDEQFFYKVRKKALGTHKQALWSLPADTRAAIGAALEQRFTFLLTRLGAAGTRALAETHAPFVPGSFPAAPAGVGAAAGPEDVTGLSD